MTTRQQPTATGAVKGHNDTEPAGSALGDMGRIDESVPVSVLVEQALDAGVVDWLAEQITEQCTPHGIPLDGDGGLLPALAAAAWERIASPPSRAVKIEITYDSDRQRITADLEPGTSLATLRDVGLGLAVTAADLHPFVAVRRGGTEFRCP
jgi:hypothetical protein